MAIASICEPVNEGKPQQWPIKYFINGGWPAAVLQAFRRDASLLQQFQAFSGERRAFNDYAAVQNNTSLRRAENRAGWADRSDPCHRDRRARPRRMRDQTSRLGTPKHPDAVPLSAAITLISRANAGRNRAIPADSRRSAGTLTETAENCTRLHAAI
jgi:hypothetical protein